MLPLLIHSLADFLWPHACPACGSAEKADVLCARCLGLMPRLDLDECRIEFDDGQTKLSVLGLYHYEGLVRELLLDLKYRGLRHAEHGLVELLLAALPSSEALGRPDVVVPVPTTWRRQRSRGFNQAALLGRPLAQALQLHWQAHALRRLREGPRQAALSRGARRRNLRGAFRARRVFGSAVLLVDDVATTGATLCACAAALRAAGARRVTALVLCRALLATPPA